MIRQPYLTPRVPDSTLLRTRNPNWRPRPTERITTTTQDHLRVIYCENEPPSGGSKPQSHRQRSTACTSHPDRSPGITLSCRNAATSPQHLQQSLAAHAQPHLRDSTPPTEPHHQAAHSRSVSTSDSYAQGGLRDSRGWPGRWCPKATTPKATPQGPEHQHPRSA